MALAMTRPWKHPKTGTYWLRKRVPLDLQAAVGKREEKLVYAPRTPGEAKRRLLEELERSRGALVQFAIGSTSISERQAHEMAAPIHDWWLQKHRENPSEQKLWWTSVGDKLWDADLILGEVTRKMSKPASCDGGAISRLMCR